MPSLLQLVLIWFAPESPRWLISKGRDAIALRTLAYYHANGDEKNPLVEYEFQEIKTALALEKELQTTQKVGWLSFIKTPGNRKRLRIIVAIAFFSQWSGNGLASYYLNKVLNNIGITNPTIQLLINGFLTIWNFFFATLGSLLCERVGRRTLFLVSTSGMLVFWALQTLGYGLYSARGDTAAGHMVIPMIFLYYGFYDIAYAPLIVSYCVEIMPYAIRAKGYTILSFSLSLSLIFNQYVNPTALAALGWKYYIVYAVWIVLELAFVFRYLVETKNRTLEQTAALFDGDGTVAQLTQEAAIHAGLVPDHASGSVLAQEGATAEKAKAAVEEQIVEEVTREV